jgi:hypothetical protein
MSKHKGTSKTKHPFNKTVIKNGRIVVIRKDGRIKADLGPYAAKKPLVARPAS